jgi:hypothetical protein
MNRFILDLDPIVSAHYHCDKHVVKMILEEAQMLSTVHQKYDSNIEGLYKPTHKHHPCTLWAGDSRENYFYAWTMLTALCAEYKYRYGKVHATSRLIEPLAIPPSDIDSKGLTPFPQAMPEQYRCDDPVEAYRTYYREAKASIAKWSVRETPEWFMSQRKV